MAYMLGITAELYPTNLTRLSNGVQPASSRNMPFGVRLLSPSSSTSRFDPLPLMTSNFFGWTMLHKMIPSFLWRNICPSRTLSCCMAERLRQSTGHYPPSCFNRLTTNFISNKENHGFPLDKLGGRDYTMYIATK